MTATTGTVVDARDGKIYKTVLMPDGKWWMAENLAYDVLGRFANGDSDTFADYGLLYLKAHFPAVTIAGCHVPVQSEIDAMISSIGGYNADTAKALADAGFFIPGNNSTGFSARPAGRYGASAAAYQYFGTAFVMGSDTGNPLAYTWFNVLLNGGYFIESTSGAGNDRVSVRLIVDSGNIPDTVAPVTYSPPAGTYGTPQTVTLSTETAGASIYYTVDGSEPDASGYRGVGKKYLIVNGNQLTNAPCWATDDFVTFSEVILGGGFGRRLAGKNLVVNQVGVGGNSRVWSNDKIDENVADWTAQSLTYTQWQDACYGNGIWIVVGEMRRVSRSLNGAAWGVVGGPVAPSTWFCSCAWHNGAFIAAGSEFDTYISVDGLDWTSPASGVPTGPGRYVYSMASNGTLLVAVGSNGRIWTSSSVNGPWTRQMPITATASTWRVVDWLGGQFIAAGYAAEIITSPDGITWTRRNFNSALGAIRGCTYDGIEYICVENSGYILRSADNGVTWTLAKPLGQIALQSVIAMGQPGNTLYAAPLTISETTTVKAIAVKAGLDDSAVSSAEYTIMLPVPPSIYPPSGTLQGVQIVVIQGPGTIRYTLDGSEPTASSPIYTRPFRLSASTTVKAKAFVNPLESLTATAALDIQGAKPEAIPSYKDRIIPLLLEQYRGDNAA